ncbi:MAG: hypothetical protein AAFR31_04550 [Cyanobacteria bacterium J06627_8]
MAQRLKRWESPRKKGRNDKGRGGSARQRQKAKQLKVLRARLKQDGGDSPRSQAKQSNQKPAGEDHIFSRSFLPDTTNIFWLSSKQLRIMAGITHHHAFNCHHDHSPHC